MRSLVTGGAGFIGSHVVDALIARGDDVLAVDDLSTGKQENLRPALAAGAGLAVADIGEASEVRRLVGDFRPQSVFHLAAQIDVRRAVADPGFDATVNVIGTVNLLEALREVDSATLVNASTGGAIYGEGTGLDLPLGEDAECRPEAPYGQSKLSAEGYVSLYRRLHGLRGTSLRLGNVYGPRQDPLGEAGVIAIFCGRLAAGKRPTVFGDGRQTRDYVYVGDVVEAFLAGEATLSSGDEAAGPYNIGTGRETDVLELAERLRRISGKSELEPEMAPARPGEVQRIAIDSGRAASELGWSAGTALERGLDRTYASVAG